MNKVFASLIVLQFIVVVGHDLIDVPGWTHGSQVQEVVGRGRVYLATVINGVFPGLAAASAVAYWGRLQPGFVTNYWVLYCATTVVLAIGMWYIPYLWGTNEEKKREYSRMYAGTRQVLPARADNPRPNLLHVCFHILFVANLVLAVLVWQRSHTGAVG